MRVNRNPPARGPAPAAFVWWKDLLSRSATLLPGLCLLLVGALVYREFLFGDAALLYRDIGTDSFVLFYTEFVHLSNYLRSQGFPSWSFHVGMGQDLAYPTAYLIWQPVSWLPSNWIAPALVFQHLGKILVAGLFFFRFLQLRRLHSPAPLLGALLLSFSAYMCIGSCWYHFADDVVCFAAILFGTEVAVQRGRWLVLALAVALVGMITPFYLYLCALFLVLYVPIRLFGQYGWQPRIILRACLKLAGVAALGVGLGAIVTLPYLRAVLNSPRGSGAISAVEPLSHAPFFGFESSLHYITAILKPFANDILGTGTDFRGWQNYLEAPLSYCGLICLLILPQVLTDRTRRHKTVYVLFLIVIIVPTLFPWFRYLFWLFQGNYYRVYSLFCVLGVITLSMMALSRYVEGRALRHWLLLATLAVLVGILYLPVELLQALISSGLRRVITILLASYGVLLIAGQLLNRRKAAAWLIVGLSAFELVLFDHITVSNRQTVKRNELEHRLSSDNEVIAALRDITASDDEKFFRITKLLPSGPNLPFTLNDAMLYGYHGTSSYRSFNNRNYTDFLTAVNAMPPKSEVDTRWSVGLLNDPILALFACEKYALVDDPLSFEAAGHYELVRRYDKGYLFRNTAFLPFGLTFDRYVIEETFLSLPASEKPAALLRAVVLSNENEGLKQGLTRATVSGFRQDATNSSLTEVVAAHRKTALELTSFNQTRFEGNVSLSQKSILVLQTPFDPGWQAFQDGHPAPSLKVDVGLLGVRVDAGEHKMELRYRNPVRVPALLVSLAALLILGAALWRWPRLNLPGSISPRHSLSR